MITLRILAFLFLVLFLAIWWVWDFILAVGLILKMPYDMARDEIREIQEYNKKFKKRPIKKSQSSRKLFPFQTFRK